MSKSRNRKPSTGFITHDGLVDYWRGWRKYHGAWGCALVRSYTYDMSPVGTFHPSLVERDPDGTLKFLGSRRLAYLADRFYKSVKSKDRTKANYYYDKIVSHKELPYQPGDDPGITAEELTHGATS